jgi:hypothetical protein
MRQLLIAAGLAALIAGSVQAQTAYKPLAKPAEAPSAAVHAAPVSVRAPALGKGYSDRQRHMADCLASAPGYDPATDLIRLRNGATRPCRL